MLVPLCGKLGEQNWEEGDGALRAMIMNVPNWLRPIFPTVSQYERVG